MCDFKGRKAWVYEQREVLHKMVLNLCLDELTPEAALTVLIDRYGEEKLLEILNKHCLSTMTMAHWRRGRQRPIE